jgi:hypothetical protein
MYPTPSRPILLTNPPVRRYSGSTLDPYAANILYVVLPAGTCKSCKLGLSMSIKDFLVGYLSCMYPLLVVR